MFKRALGTCALTVIFAAPAPAATIFTDLGTLAPPATLGGYDMTPFSDQQAEGIVNGVASPLGGTLTFSSSLDHDATAPATWGHGYGDDVYHLANPIEFPFLGELYFLVLGLPSDTAAFYLYAQASSAIGVWEPGLADPIFPDISGDAGMARGFGFHSDSGGTVSQVWLASMDEFTVGEFGIAAVDVGASSVPAVPEPASLLLLGTGMAGLAARFRRRRSSR